MKSSKFFTDLLRDKNGYFNLRETVTALFVIVILISWVSEQFFSIPVPEHMFYSFVSLVGAGCFGYSLERKQKNQYHEHNQQFNENAQP